MRTIGEVKLGDAKEGAVFAVVDSGYGPTILIDSAQEANPAFQVRVHATSEALAALGLLFLNASKHQGYSASPASAADVAPTSAGPLAALAEIASALRNVAAQARPATEDEEALAESTTSIPVEIPAPLSGVGAAS